MYIQYYPYKNNNISILNPQHEFEFPNRNREERNPRNPQEAGGEQFQTCNVEMDEGTKRVCSS